MGKFTTTHEINCDSDTFWKMFLDQEFNELLYLKNLNYPEFKLIDSSETDKELLERWGALPNWMLPGPVAKLLGSAFRYLLEYRLDKASKVCSFKLIPSTLADKLRLEGTSRVESVGDTKIHQIREVTIEAKMFGVGTLMESSLEKQLRGEYDQTALLMNQRLAALK